MAMEKPSSENPGSAPKKYCVLKSPYCFFGSREVSTALKIGLSSTNHLFSYVWNSAPYSEAKLCGFLWNSDIKKDLEIVGFKVHVGAEIAIVEDFAPKSKAILYSSKNFPFSPPGELIINTFPKGVLLGYLNLATEGVTALYICSSKGKVLTELGELLKKANSSRIDIARFAPRKPAEEGLAVTEIEFECAGGFVINPLILSRSA